MNFPMPQPPSPSVFPSEEPLSLHSKHTSAHRTFLSRLHLSLLLLSRENANTDFHGGTPTFVHNLSNFLYSIAPHIALSASVAEQCTTDFRKLQAAISPPRQYQRQALKAMQLAICEDMSSVCEKLSQITSSFHKYSQDALKIQASNNTASRHLGKGEPQHVQQQLNVEKNISSIRRGIAQTDQELDKMSALLKSVEKEETTVENQLFCMQCAYTVTYPLRIAGFHAYDRQLQSTYSHLQSTRVSVDMAAEESVRLITQRAMFAKELHSLRAKRQFAKRCVNACKNGINNLVTNVVELRHIADTLNGMASVWNSLASAACHLHNSLQMSTDNEDVLREDGFKDMIETSHIISVLSRVFSFDHIDVRNVLLANVQTHRLPHAT